MSNKNYPDINIVKEKILEWSKIFNKYPHAKNIMEYYKELPQSKNTYIKHYGVGLNEIISECNIHYKKTKHKKNKFTSSELLNHYKFLFKELQRIPTMSDIDQYRDKNKKYPSAHTYTNRFSSIDDVIKKCNLKSNKIKNNQYTSHFLISELKRFYNEFGRIPIQKDFEYLKGYPSRKTFINHFGKFNAALKSAGFEISEKQEYTREYLLNEIKRFISEFDRIPNAKDMDQTKNYPTKHVYSRTFGSWNNALKVLNLETRVSYYTDEELEQLFMRFVEENNRIPTIEDFNNNASYPSFWTYQNRFGSWNKAVNYYGFEANQGATSHNYKFDDGEICQSRYEFDVSNWFRNHGVYYIRNFEYKKVIKEYKGKKNCDYVIFNNDKKLFIEIAGLYTDNKNKSSMEKDYIKRFNHKLNLLQSSGLNYLIIYPRDFKEKTLDEMFSFLFEEKEGEMVG